MAVDWGYDFYESSYSIPNNTSQVRLRIWITTSGSSYTYDTKYGTVWFAGEQGISYILPPDTTTVVYDQTKTWSHNATTGEGTAAFACELPTTPSGGTKGVGDTYITLTKIPRYLTITNYTISQINVNSVRIDWATSDPRDNTQLSINNGAWRGSAEVDPNEHVASDNKSGYFIVSGLSAKTNYNMKIKIRRADSQQWTESQNKSITTYAAPTIGLNSRTETSIKLNYNMNDSTQQVSTLQYRKKKSTESSWSGWTTVSGAANTSSGNFNVTGLTENTTYNFEVKFTRKANSTVYTASTSQTTYAYPYATTSPNFIVGNSLSITLKNDASRTCKVYLKIGNNTSSLYVQTSNTTASGFNTAAWKEWLYANLPTKKPTAYQVVVVENASSTTRTRNAGNTVTINETECKPIYDTSNGFDYTDVNSNITALTGNNQIIVKGYSDIAATVSTSQKATAPSGTSSSIVDYTLKVGNQTARNTYSSDSAVRIPATGSIQGVNPDIVSGQGTISVIATDSRGLTTTSSKTATVKEYTQPVISNITATRSLNGAGEEVTLNLTGTYWKESFGTSNNTIVSVIYKFRKSTTQTWTTGTTTITPTLSGDNNTFKVENLSIRGDTSEGKWTANDTYIIRIEVKDTLLNAVSSNVVGEYTIVAGTPAIAIYKNNVAIGKQYDTSKEEQLQVSGKVRCENGATNKDTGIECYRSDTNIGMMVGIGGGGTNHGIYSRKLDKWIVYGDNTNVYLKGTADNATKWAGTTYDMSTANDTDTWIPVLNNGKFQHTSKQKWTSKTHSNYNNNQNQLATISCLTYWNGAYNSSNSSNLTYAYQGTIQCKPKNLYNNASGTTGTVTLSETSANFSYIEIYFAKDLSNNLSCVRVFSPNGKKPRNVLGTICKKWKLDTRIYLSSFNKWYKRNKTC